ncbi:transposase [Alkalihalobacterium alkalinitrilicum]|uniref:transposase n=1 Tax=Alkalihalobacterium alkalinitrilicum TaxID=427920 RepID=UPI001154BED9|nr:transposase [Alkalihalobacterium alkalinitrilicum]
MEFVFSHGRKTSCLSEAKGKEIGVSEISGSQLSRRINDLPTEFVQKLFIKVVQKIKQLTQSNKGLPDGIGRLSIVDSTEIRLPEQLCDWAFISKGHNAVKMHTRLKVVSPDIAFPDKIVRPTSNGHFRYRWVIELFLKWIKQHLTLTKIWSTKPQGIWNKMFLALIAYWLSLIVKLEANFEKTPWEFFRILQTYLYKTVSSFKKALRLKKKRKSKGRQKVPIPIEKKTPSFGNVALIKEKTNKSKRKNERKLGNY